MPDPSIEFPVRASILTIPDGRTDDTLRLSLQITPSRDPTILSSSAPQIALASWPTQVAAQFGRLSVHLAPIDAKGAIDSTRMITLAPSGSFRSRGWTGAPAAGAQRLWTMTFPGGLDPLWQELQKMASPDAGSQADVPVLAPTIDSRRLAESLITSQVDAARSRINGLADPKKAGAAAAPDLRATRALEAWAIPGATTSDKKVLAPELAEKRQAEVKAAINTALDGATSAPPVWATFTSYAMLEAFANGEKLKGPLDKRLSQALRDARPTGNPELLSSRLKSLALTVPPSGPNPAPPGPVAVEAGEIERRKLGAMLSFPTIAQYLCMIADIDILREQWDREVVAAGLGERGAIAVTFGDAAPDSVTNWTAYLCAPKGAAGLPAYFGPAEQSEATGNPDENRKLARGLLNLSATRSDHGVTAARFSLSVVDVINSAKRRIAHARRALGETSPIESDLPELGGRGIAVIDSGAQEDEAAARAAAVALTARADRLHFADDLLIGYRPIVGLAPRGASGLAIDRSRWRSLVARRVAFDSQIDQAFVHANYNDEREHGHTRSPVGVQRGTDANGKPIDVLLNHPELFVWTGDSLAVPSVAEDAESGQIEVDATTDLPIGITYSLPNAASGAAVGLMPLRDGRRYAFGASAMFVNGCGLSVDATIAAMAADPRRALGKDGEAFTFTRCETLPPPVVLLPADNRLVKQPDLSGYPGETLTTLVIRRGDSEMIEHRFLFPEQVAFDRAEQQDMFRDDRRAKPWGAFGSAAGVGATRDPTTGRFPEARDRRGPILQIAAPTDGKAAREYYPDAYTRGLWAHIDAVHPLGAPAPTMTTAVPFRKGAKAISVQPILLEIKKNESSRFESEPRFQLSADRWHDLPELGVRIPKISIVMAPASMATIELVPDFDPDEILDKHLIGRSLANSWAANGKPIGRAAVRARLEAALPKGRISELQGATKLTIVHAVPQPLHPPQFGPDFRPIVMSVRSAADPDGKSLLLPWSTTVADNLKQGVPLANWSKPGGATCFFIGSIKIDAPSTGVVSCDGEWEDWGPEMVRFNPEANVWERYHPKQFARLFTLNDFSSDVDAGDLALHDIAVVPQGVAYAFRDGRARQVELKLIARSRFAQYYPTGGVPSNNFGNVGPHECLSIPIEKWVPCNFRPAQPNIDRVMPLLDMKTSEDARRQTFSFSRTTGFRIELGDGCYGSGKGEQLALVFNSQQSTGVCDYSTELLRPFATGVTRWGRDPLHQGKLAKTNLVPENFSGFQEQHSRFRLPAAKDSERPDASTESLLDVLALAYDLQFDPRIGRFYVDIGTQGREDIFADTFMPFVQLGLARLQVNAVDGLQLSAPVGEMVQVLPRRSGWIRFRKPRDGRSFNFWMEAARSPGVDAAQQWVLEVTAVRKDPTQPDGWAPQLAGRGAQNPVRLVKKRSDASGREFSVWHIDGFRMEGDRFADHLGVQIEEFEEVVLEDGSTLRRLLFGHIVDFGSPSSR